MKASLHRALVGVQTDLDPTLSLHKKIAKALYRGQDIHGVSGIYQFTDDEILGLTVVYSLRTDAEPKELNNKMIEISKALRSTRFSIEVLVFDDVILRTPDFVLPSMALHRLKRWCLPAADLWGDYIHPIEGKDLKILSEMTGSPEKIEFYAQNKTLLDFLAGET
jgi:hypothetical protein